MIAQNDIGAEPIASIERDDGTRRDDQFMGWTDIEMNAASASSDQAADQDEEPVTTLSAFGVPTMDGAEAAPCLQREIGKHFAGLVARIEANAWRLAHIEALEAEEAQKLVGASEEEIALARARIKAKATRATKRKFGKAMKAPRTQIAGAAGLGKTKATIKELCGNPILWTLRGAYYAPTIDLCEAVASDINSNAPAGMPVARVIRGRTIADATQKPLCARWEVVEEAEGRVPSIFKSFCDDGKGKRCEFYGRCPYIEQRLDTSPGIRVSAHANLVVSQAPELSGGAPDFAIVDETCVSTFITKTWVDARLFAETETYYCASALPEQNAEAHCHAETGGYVMEQIARGPDFLQQIRDQGSTRPADGQSRGGANRSADVADLASLPKRCRAAAEAAVRESPGQPISPGDTDECVRIKLKELRPNSGRRVATVLRQIARDLENGTVTSKAIEWVAATTGRKAPGSKRDAAAIDSFVWHGLKNLSFPESVPLLLIDADANLNINTRLFCRGKDTPPLRSVEVQARRRGRVIQCDSSTFSKRGFERDEGRGLDLCQRILKFAEGRVTDGRRVLIVFNKPIRKMFTGETADKLPLYFPIGDCIEVTHFGAFIGQNRWSDFDSVIIVGREQPRAKAVEDMARAIYGDDPTVSLDLTGAYIAANRPYGPESDCSARIDAHADPRVQEILELIREKSSCQGIDRIRLVHRDKRAPEVIIFCNLPLPGIVPDQLASAKDIFNGGSRIERAIDRGFVSTNAALMAGMYADLWVSKKAAEHDLAWTRSETPEMYIDHILFTKGVFLIGEFRVRRKGANRWSKFWFDPAAVSDPEGAIRVALTVPTDLAIEMRILEDRALGEAGTVFTDEMPAGTVTKVRHVQDMSVGAALQSQHRAPNLRLISGGAEEDSASLARVCRPGSQLRIAA